jgi:hypothetical protein
VLHDAIVELQVSGRQSSRHHIAPQIRGSGIAVLKDDRCALTFIDTGHASAFDFEIISSSRKDDSLDELEIARGRN